MKRISKIFAALLAVMMLLLPLTGVFAEPGESPEPSASPNPALCPAEGTLTIHKYIGDDITQWGDRNDGHETTLDPNPTFTAPVPSPLPTPPFTALDGVKFKLYRVILDPDYIDSDGNYTGSPFDSQFDDNFDNPLRETDYAVDNFLNPTTVTTQKVGEAAITFAVEYVEEITTDANGIAVSSTLPRGFYLVIEQPDARVASPIPPFIVAVPMTNKDNNGWITDVHVYPKNEDIKITKDSNKTVATLGEEVTWTILVNIPADIANYKKYDIIDILDSALTFVPGSLEVKGKVTSGGTAYTIPNAGSVNYSVSSPAGSLPIGTPNTSETIKISFTAPGRQILREGTGTTAEPVAYRFLEITFKTTVNANIYDKDFFTVDNQATVEFTNRFDQDKSRSSNRPRVHTGQIILRKTDANTGAGLNGAEFQIASSLEKALAGIYLRRIQTGTPLRYNIIVDDNDPRWATAEPWVVVTAGGNATTPATATFFGLADYVDGTPKGPANATYLKYWIVETKAPEGYNLLNEPVECDFVDSDVSKEVSPGDSKLSYTIYAGIVNTNRFRLPRTGGIGTILFTAGGVAILGAVAIMFAVSATRKRRNAINGK